MLPQPEQSSPPPSLLPNPFTVHFLLGPPLAPGSHTLTFPDNRSEPSFQSHGGLSASIGEPCNVFDVELANIGHGTEGSQLQNTGLLGNDSCYPNGGVCHDEQEPHIEEPRSGSCHRPEPGKNGATIDGSAAIETPLDLSRPPSCISGRANLEDCDINVDHVDQVFYQAQRHDRMGAAHTDEGCVSRDSSVSCGALAREECNSSYDRATSGDSRGEPDRPPLFSTKSSPAVEDEAAPGKQSDVTGSVSSDERDDSSQGETSRRRRAHDHEPNQESGRNEGDLPSYSQLTTQSGRRCLPSPEEPRADTPKRNPSIAVVVPVPPWARMRVTRSTTRASARKRGLQHGQGSDSDHCAAGSSIESAERFGKKRQCREKTPPPSCAVGPASAGGLTSMQSDCSPQNQNILGRAILTVQSDGSKPAYFFTFMPEPVLVPSPQDPHHRWLKAAGPPANISGRPRLYSSEDNALLVRLKEREGMSWSEIAQHFPGRNVSSLQVHYSAKLRNKAVARCAKTTKTLRVEVLAPFSLTF